MDGDAYQKDMIELLKDIRDTQQELLAHAANQTKLFEQRVTDARKAVEDSLALQRQGLERQKAVARMAIPIVIVGLAAILYLVLRYGQRCEPGYSGLSSSDLSIEEEYSPGHQ